MGESYTVSLEKGALIVYLAALKKGAIRAAHPYHVIYRELPPPPPPRVTVTPQSVFWKYNGNIRKGYNTIKLMIIRKKTTMNQ